VAEGKILEDHVVVAPAGQGDRTQEQQCPFKHVLILSGVAAESNTGSVDDNILANDRREILEKKVLPRLPEPVRYSAPLDAELPVLIQSVKAHGFEGLVAKRRNSAYEPGLRSGAWMKMRVDRGQEFVIGGYTRGTKTFDALVFGYYEGDKLIYAARTRNGFTPATRAQLFRRFKGLEISECPFANLPEARGGRWGQGLTKAKMAECQWLKPVLVGQFEFLEWTGDNHLRHSKFVGLREDKKARDVVRE
jgi:ATP-dependent DNA ligase